MKQIPLNIFDIPLFPQIRCIRILIFVFVKSSDKLYKILLYLKNKYIVFVHLN